MLQIDCHGCPYDIGHQHGAAAKQQIKGSTIFYEALFKKTAGLNWVQAQQEARKFIPYLEADWPHLVEEMKGVADGAGIDLDAIISLNVRTEIAYGMFNDGCTAFSWKSHDASFLAQNWDWNEEQKPNIVALKIAQDSKPSIHMMTEAGIIGKIGLNSSGVGVTLNAIKAKGRAYNRLPCHLALRTALDSVSRQEAVDRLLKAGVASSCHILVADETRAVGLECTAFDTVQLPMKSGIVTHTNHFMEPHVGPESKLFLIDSPFRLDRVRHLLKENGDQPSVEKIEQILKDEKNDPAAICRTASEKNTTATLFSIIMDLRHRQAQVKMGKPTAPDEALTLHAN